MRISRIFTIQGFYFLANFIVSLALLWALPVEAYAIYFFCTGCTAIRLKCVIKPYVDIWRQELKAKVRSDMFSVILEDALDPLSKTKTASAKYLLDKYMDPSTATAKKKSKSDNRKELDQKILDEQNQEDWKRVKEMIQ